MAIRRKVEVRRNADGNFILSVRETEMKRGIVVIVEEIVVFLGIASIFWMRGGRIYIHGHRYTWNIYAVVVDG